MLWLGRSEHIVSINCIFSSICIQKSERVGPHPFGQSGQLVKRSLGPKSQVPDPQSQIPGPRSRILKNVWPKNNSGQQKMLAKKEFWLKFVLPKINLVVIFFG